MFTNFGRDFVTAVRRALGRVLRASAVGLVIGALVAELAGFALNGGWPPQMFTHLVAGGLALTLGYSLAVTVAAVEGVRGMVLAAARLDDVAKATADRGLDVVDAVVDALDGPDRHGFRGVRGVN
ncbi:MAG: hypothetical protein ACHQ4H_01585 [Ktedonobacterales bacterium]